MPRVALPHRRPKAGVGGGPPQVHPMDLNSVKSVVREFDRAAYGEAFRGDRLVKIAILGKGSTSTVWKAVDVDTLRVVAVKDMIVCDSKQSAILRHELCVLHPQLQPLVRPKSKRLSGRLNRGTTPPAFPTIANPDAVGPVTAPTFVGNEINCSRDNMGASGRGCGPSNSSRPEPCPFMPRYFGSFVWQDDGGRPRVSIVLEHIPGVDLARWIEEMGGSSTRSGGTGRPRINPEQPPPDGGRSPPPPLPPIPETWLPRVCRDMLEALRYLHERRFIHRDVKPANLLLGPGGAKLVDFGSTIGEDEEEGARMHGTLRFMSPERLCAKAYRPSSDLWAAGLTVASAALGENPVPHSANQFEAAERAEAAFDMVVKHPASSGLSPTLLDFLRVVLVADPEKRPTVEQMLSHPFVCPVPADSVAGGGGVGSSSGGGILGAFRRGGSVLKGARRRVDERARTAAAQESSNAKQQGDQQRPPGGTSSSSSSGSGGGTDVLEEAWSEGVLETLRRLARKKSDASTPTVDASEIIRRVLAARRSRWGQTLGYGSGLKNLDFSHLAVELDVSSAELRSLFGSVAANMHGEYPAGCWSSLGVSSASVSPAPATLPPLGADRCCSRGRSRSNTPERPVQREAKAPLSPLRTPPVRSPVPRRRPAPLIMSPGARTPRPVSAVSASALSVLSGLMAHSPTATTPAPTSSVPDESLPAPVRMGMSATWARGWVGKNRTRPPGVESAGCVSGTNVEGKGTAALVAVDGGRGNSSQRGGGVGSGGGVGGGGNGAWWKGWGQRRRLLRPRVFKIDKAGSGGAGVAGRQDTPVVSSSSARALVPLHHPPLTVTPPLSKFDEEADGNAGSGGGDSAVREREDHVDAKDDPLGRARGIVGTTAAAAAALPELSVYGGPAPAWGEDGW